MSSNPRALPPVTQSSALQAPERMWESCDLTTHPHRTDASHSTLLSGGQHHDMMHHIALRCLEGSTMSNLVHRRRRCARIVPHSILLPGGQYARGQGRSLHQAKDIVVAPWEPFCTANGSYFALWLSVCQGQTRRMWRVRQGSSLTWLSMRIRLQGRKPGESNKLFDLIVLPQDTVRPIRSIRGRNTNRKHSGAWRALP